MEIGSGHIPGNSQRPKSDANGTKESGKFRDKEVFRTDTSATQGLSGNKNIQGQPLDTKKTTSASSPVPNCPLNPAMTPDSLMISTVFWEESANPHTAIEGVFTLPPLMMQQFNNVLKAVKTATGKPFVSGTVCRDDQTDPPALRMIFIDKTSDPQQQFVWSATSGDIVTSSLKPLEQQFIPLFEYYNMSENRDPSMEWIRPVESQTQEIADNAYDRQISDEIALEEGKQLIQQNLDYFNQQAESTQQKVISGAKTYQWQTNECVGLGVGGRVFKARETGTQEPVCIKQSWEDNISAGFAKNELAALGTLSHPNIVKLKGADTANHVLILEWCNGSLIEPGFLYNLPVKERAKIVQDTADALIYMHNQGFSHGDMKMDNMMLKDGKAVLTDFGNALDFRTTHTVKKQPTDDMLAEVKNGTLTQEQLDRMQTYEKNDQFSQDNRGFIGMAYKILCGHASGSVMPNNYARELSRALQQYPLHIRNEAISLFSRYQNGETSNTLLNEITTLVGEMIRD